MELLNVRELDLVKGFREDYAPPKKGKNKAEPKPITRTQAKAVHKELPPGGSWRTIRGHHVYIKDGKVLAGAIPGVTGAKKATKAHLAEHQATVDAESKGAKKDAKGKKDKKSSATSGSSRSSSGSGSKSTKASGGSAKPAKDAGKKKDKPALVVEPKKAAAKTKAKKEDKKEDKKADVDTKTKAGRDKKATPKPKSSAAAKKGASEDGKGKNSVGKTSTGAGASGNKPASKPTSKPATGKGRTTEAAGKRAGGAVAGDAAKPKSKPKAEKAPAKAAKGKNKAEVKDVRTDVQKNRKTSYDVGEELAGARKHEDHARETFQGKPTLANLDKLESISPKLAHQMVSKDNLLPKGENVVKSEYNAGTDLQTYLAKQMVYGRVVQRPADTPEARRQYVAAVQRLQAVLEPVRNFDQFKAVVHDMGEWLYHRKLRGDDDVKVQEEIVKKRKAAIGTPVTDEELARPSWLPRKAEWDVEKQRKRIEEGRVIAHKKAKERLEVLKRGAGYNFGILGDSFSNFFRDQNSLNGSLDRVSAKVKEVGGSWDSYLSDDAKKALDKKPKAKGESKTKVKWERVMPKVLKREGGRKTKVSKPEDAVKAFGFRGVQFGHWVDDTSGKYHLEKASEAFHDMADILGFDDKDVSMNGRIGMAFGARGKGGALAHYEPQNKVINLTKEGGAGSLAHEWGHALDNLMWEHSHNFDKGSVGYASEGDHGKDMHPTVAHAYNALRKAMNEGEATEEVARDDSRWNTSPTLERHYNNAGGDVGKAVASYLADAKATMDGHHRRLKEMGYDPDDPKSAGGKNYAKSVRSYKQAQKNIPQAMMHLHEKKTGEKLASVQVPNGKSHFKSVAESDFSGYLGSEREMFARAFEAYLEDKLHDNKRRNDYLVTGTKAGSVGKGNSLGSRSFYQMFGMHAVYPQGEERQRINQAMETLIESIKYSKSIKKALDMEILKGIFVEDELRKKANEYMEKLAILQARRDPDGIESAITERSAYDIDHETDPAEVIYIPVNRLNMVYQTDQATDWDKVKSNMDRMRAGEGLKPIEIGYDYDVHDGHHRWIGSKELDYTHVPCIVKGKDEAERQEAIARYRELWKSVVTDPVLTPGYTPTTPTTSPFDDSGIFMYRGIGQKELDFITRHGFIESKGKGNDDDKGKRSTCFTELFQQAEGYAVTNYTQYGEPAAYVIALPRPPWVYEDEHGELISDRPVPTDLGVVSYIPNPDGGRTSEV